MCQFNIPDTLIPFEVELTIPDNINSFFEISENNQLDEIFLNDIGKLPLIINTTQYYCQFYFLGFL